MDSSTAQVDKVDILRSKLYLLDDASGWIDQGTGIPIITRNQKNKAVMKFVSEEEARELYEMEINDDITFEKQEDKILTWYNEKTNIDMALSFQQQDGADVLWKKILDIQTRNARDVYGPWIQDYIDNGRDHKQMDDYEDSENEVYVADIGLPVPDESNLEKFEGFILNYSNPLDRRNQIANVLVYRKVYLDRLFDIFTKAEKDNKIETCIQLYKVFRNIVSIANYDLYSLLMNEENYLNVFGILEYDPDMYNKSKAITHRKYFLEQASFKIVVNIKDQDVIKLIHFNFRLLYLRDCALAHFLDDRTIQLISAIIQANYIDIIKHMHASKDVLSGIFEAIRTFKSGALKLIHEILTIIKGLELDRTQIIETLSEYGLFDTLEEAMKNQQQQQQSTLLTKPNKKQGKGKDTNEWDMDSKLVLNTILEIFIMCVVHAPIYLKKYATTERQKILKYPFLSFIAESIITNPETQTQNLFGELLKHLIDTDVDEENECRNVFYDLLLGKLLKVFDDVDSTSEKLMNSKQVVCDIIIFCEKQQIKKIKEAVLQSDLLNKVFTVFKSKNKFLILIAIQIFKLFLVSKEDSITKALIEPLNTILTYYMATCKKKQNLIYSAILDIVSSCIKEELVDFLQYIKISHQQFLKDPSVVNLGGQLENKLKMLENNDNDMERNSSQEEEPKKYSDIHFLMMSAFLKKAKPNLTIISPFGSTITPDNPVATKVMGKSSQIGNNSSVGKRTSSSLTKLVDYEDDGDYIYDKNQKENHALLEDIQLKKRKLDDNGNHVKIINNPT